MRRLHKAIVLTLAALALLPLAPAARAAAPFKNWAARSFEFEQTVAGPDGKPRPRRQYVIYPEICAWYGALTVARLTKDKDLSARLFKEFDQFLTPEGDKHVSRQSHVDYSV